jgi:hypothetical protein
MAYMSQENKASKMPAIKAVLKKYGMKGSVAVRHYSTLVVNLRSGNIDFAADTVVTPALMNNAGGEFRGYDSVNVYWIEKFYSGRAAAFLTELKAAMSDGNYDNSDVMTDYFDVGWYNEINVGRFDKHYVSA